MVPPAEPHLDEDAQLRTVKAALQRRFADRLPEETISRELDQGLQEFSGAPVRTFIPVLLQKQVAERLRGLSA